MSPVFLLPLPFVGATHGSPVFLLLFLLLFVGTGLCPVRLLLLPFFSLAAKRRKYLAGRRKPPVPDPARTSHLFFCFFFFTPLPVNAK